MFHLSLDVGQALASMGQTHPIFSLNPCFVTDGIRDNLQNTHLIQHASSAFHL